MVSRHDNVDFKIIKLWFNPSYLKVHFQKLV